MNDIAWFPDLLARHDAAISRDIAQDEGRAPSPPMPHEIGSDNIDDVKRAINRAEERCAVAEAAFEAADTVDADKATLNRAEAEYEAAVEVLAALENRLEELEQTAGHKEWLADRSNAPIW